MADDQFYYGAPAQGPQPEPSALQRLTEFFGPINKGFQAAGFQPPDPETGVPPADYGPLAIALGLLHPRLGGAVRDVGMSRQMMNRGDTPAVLRDPGVPFGAGRQLETLGAPYAARPGAQPPAGNSNAPAVMHPQQGPLMQPPGNANYLHSKGIFE